MSASVVLTRNPSFDALQAFTMPSATMTMTCRAAAAVAVRRAPPAPASPCMAQTSNPAAVFAAPVQPTASNRPEAAAGLDSSPAMAPALLPASDSPTHLPEGTTPLPIKVVHCAADREAQDLADQLEDLLVFTRPSHPGPDPQLLVHSPPADALRPPSPPAQLPSPETPPLPEHCVSSLAAASSTAEAVTPRAPSVKEHASECSVGPGAACPAQQAMQLSPVSQLTLMEGPSLEEILRGPRPLREIALEVSGTPCLNPAFLQDLSCPTLPLLEADVATAAAAQPGRAAIASAAALPQPQRCRDESSACLPLTRSCASLPLSPSKSNGAMIQLAQLHKGEWHSSASDDSDVSDWEEDSSLDTTCSEDEASDDSMESAFRSRPRSRPAFITQPRPATPQAPVAAAAGVMVEGVQPQESQETVDAILTPEGVMRVMQHTSQQRALPSTLPPAATAEGEEGEESVVVAVQPASTIPVPLTFPVYATMGARMMTENPMSCEMLDSELDSLPTAFAAASYGGGCDTLPLHYATPSELDLPPLRFETEEALDPTPAGAYLDAKAPLPLLPPTASPAFLRFLQLLRTDSREFEAGGRVLRLRRYLRADVAPAVLDAVLDALAVNTRVEALYIQNFEKGMGDAQLESLGRVLAQGRIWAVNVGENFRISRQAWEHFCEQLLHTAVGYLYVSEAHLQGTDLKGRMMDAIRKNRSAWLQVCPPRDPQVVVHVGNMWWNPRLPGAPTRTEGGGGSGAQPFGAGCKRLSSELECECEGACCSPRLRRSSALRVGFRGSLVAGASRATLLRPLPPKMADPASVAAGAAGTAAATDAARGNTMLTRARAGVAVGAPQTKDLEAVEVAVDDDDDDYHVEDDSPLSDDDYEDDSLPHSRRLPLRSTRRHVAMAVTPARVSRRLLEKSGCSASHPLGTAPASPYLSPVPPPKRLRGAISRDSSTSLGEAGTAEGPAVQTAVLSAGPAAGGPAPMDTEATSPSGAALAEQLAGYGGISGGKPAIARAAAGVAATPRAAAAAGGGRRGGAVGGVRGRAAPAKRGGSGGLQRAQRSDLKGKPSFWELVEGGFMHPGQYQFTVGTQDVAVTIEEDGGIRYGSTRFRAISKFALVVLRERNPSRQSCDGWKEVAWNGEKLDMLRLRFQQYQRQQARRGPAMVAPS